MNRALDNLRIYWQAPPPWLWRFQLALYYLKRPKAAFRFLLLLRDYKPRRPMFWM
jgi:hypothetical protein